MKTIIWDFDGVILDSNDIKSEAFRIVLSNMPNQSVDEFLKFHKNNGGISRYIKFKHFFENILLTSVSEADIIQLSNRYSDTVKDLVIQPKLINKDVLDFIQSNNDIQHHIVSATEDIELKYICLSLDLTKFFVTISGSQNAYTQKHEIVANILRIFNNDAVLIGDSINDYHAALKNNIPFISYNQDEELVKKYNLITFDNWQKNNII